MAVLVDLCLCYCTFAFVPPSKQKTPDLLKEVGFGRRVRGNANLINILIRRYSTTIMKCVNGFKEICFDILPKWVMHGVRCVFTK